MPVAFLKGWLLGLSVAAPLGPVNIVVFRTVLSRGARAAVAVAAGAATVDAVYLGLAILGAASFQMPQWLRAAIGLAGSIVLFRLAINTYRNPPPADGTKALLDQRPGEPALEACPARKPAAMGLLAGYSTGIAVTATNPMAIFFWASVGSALASTGGGTPALGPTYTGVIAGVLTWHTFAANFWALVRGRVSSAILRAVNTICAIVMFYYSLGFLWNALSLAGIR